MEAGGKVHSLLAQSNCSPPCSCGATRPATCGLLSGCCELTTADSPAQAKDECTHGRALANPIAGQSALPRLHFRSVLNSTGAGAYIFRPNGTETMPGPLSFTVVEGPVVSEVHQHWTNYTSLTARCVCCIGAGGALRLGGRRQMLSGREPSCWELQSHRCRGGIQVPQTYSRSCAQLDRWPASCANETCPASPILRPHAPVTAAQPGGCSTRLERSVHCCACQSADSALRRPSINAHAPMRLGRQPHCISDL